MCLVLILRQLKLFYQIQTALYRTEQINRESEENIVNQKNETRYGYGRTMDIVALCAYTGLGKYAAKGVAESAGATIHLGRRVVYDRARIDAYMDSMTVKAVD